MIFNDSFVASRKTSSIMWLIGSIVYSIKPMLHLIHCIHNFRSLLRIIDNMLAENATKVNEKKFITNDQTLSPMNIVLKEIHRKKHEIITTTKNSNSPVTSLIIIIIIVARSDRRGIANKFWLCSIWNVTSQLKSFIERMLNRNGEYSRHVRGSEKLI